MNAPQKILELVDLFRRNADAYHAPQYNEAMVRQEFINPFFKCLGWDMDNEQGYAEAYKDVIHEAAIKIGGATKAPDYCFRIGGAAKFFLEAKRHETMIAMVNRTSNSSPSRCRRNRPCSSARSTPRIGRLTGSSMNCTA